MIYRCLNKNCKAYHNYGGRGINVCDRWIGNSRSDGFKNFMKDMGASPPDMEIDRINNDGEYSPENCRWVSQTENSRNRRATRYLSINGETKPLAEWSDLTGICRYKIHNRLNLGWTPEEALGFKSRPKIVKPVNKIEQISRIISTFSKAKKPRKCARCGKPHVNGFVVELNDGSKITIGKACLRIEKKRKVVS